MRLFCLARRHVLRSLILSGAALVVAAGCTSFDHLTKVPAAGEPGPKASECGSCHGQQYREWQQSTHAKASTNAAFMEAAGDPPEEECLQCHATLSVHDKPLHVRSFNRDEGVTCISCHLVDGAMHGPHPSTALVSPHPITEDSNIFASSALCAPCHGETYGQWQKANTAPAWPTCQECHQGAVERTATQGTNLFSDLLVAFEQSLPSRSHDIRLENMASFPEVVSMTLTLRSPVSASRILEVKLTNNLPHDLPTGTYGAKEIRLQLVPDREERPLNGQGVVLASAADALASGAMRKMELPVPANSNDRPLHLQLVRTSPDAPNKKPIILASIPVPSFQEAKP